MRCSNDWGNRMSSFTKNSFTILAHFSFLMMTALLATPAQAADDKTVLDGREARLGVLYHDATSGSRVESGLDLNLEVLWQSPTFLEAVLSPRPHLGLSLNTAGDTSQIYAGLTWSWLIADPIFIEIALGGAVHDGETGRASRDERAMGCRALFREAFSVGGLIGPSGSLSLEISHISNAGLCDDNAGLTNLGLRYGLAF